MNKRKIVIVSAIAAAAVALSGLVLYERSLRSGYVPAEDEIALQMQLDTGEDIGLLVYDYLADGHEYSGGISNADGSLLRHDDPGIVVVWSRQQLESASDTVELSMRFRVITEYVDPNFENVYPEDITSYVEDTVSWTARFGEAYQITITGDRANGYKAVRTARPGEAPGPEDGADGVERLGSMRNGSPVRLKGSVDA